MDKEYLEIAARMLGDSDTGMLNIRLVTELNNVNDLCLNAGGELRSRQVIAMIINNWVINNSKSKAYGD